jgi:hypothetical protein
MATCESIIMCKEVRWETPSVPTLVHVLDGLVTNTIPGVCPEINFAIQLVDRPGEEVNVLARMVDPSGKTVGEAGAKLTIGSQVTNPPEVSPTIAKHYLHIKFQKVPIEQRGDYGFNVYLDGTLRKSLTFYIVLLQD